MNAAGTTLTASISHGMYIVVSLAIKSGGLDAMLIGWTMAIQLMCVTHSARFNPVFSLTCWVVIYHVVIHGTDNHVCKMYFVFFVEMNGKAFNPTYEENLLFAALQKQIFLGPYNPKVCPEIGFFDVLGNDRR